MRKTAGIRYQELTQDDRVRTFLLKKALPHSSYSSLHVRARLFP